MRKFLMLVTLMSHSLVAPAQVPAHLVGTWLVDSIATEEYLNKVEPPPMEKRGWMGGTLGFQFVSTITFAEGTLSIRWLAYSMPTTTYQLSPAQGDGLEFFLENEKTKDRIAVTFINDRNIVIRSTKTEHPRMDFIEYAVWKRSESADPHPKTYEEGVKVAQQKMAEFQAVVKNVPFLNCLAPQPCNAPDLAHKAAQGR